MPLTPYQTNPDPVASTALSGACDSVRPGAEPDAVGGIIPAFVVSPSSTAGASAVLRACAEHDLAVVPRGSGSRLRRAAHETWGAPPSRCDVVLDTLRMSQVIEHAAGDLVARVQAGARFGDVASALAAAGQEIALDVPPTATIGGMVADALAGPRRLRYGSPRDLLIGITIVRADGTVARSGGKVVKNVAGYDLGKLFAGSAGTLGLITEATFRLHPLPAARAWVTAEFPGATGANGADGGGSAVGGAGSAVIAAAVAAAANSALVASAVELHRAAPGGPVSVSVLLEGSADGVDARALGMGSELARAAHHHSPALPATQAQISAAAPNWWGGVPDPAGGTLLRVTFWVSALGKVLDAIDAAARETGLRPVVSGSAGAGVLYVTLPAEADPGEAARLARLVHADATQGRGGVGVLAGPGAVRTGTGAGAVPGLNLMRAVKDQFDPGGRMAPGRVFG